jgi:hypothetical protein
MNSRCAYFAVIALALIPPLDSAEFDLPADEIRLTPGATGTLDAVTGFSGLGRGRASLRGTVLGEASWNSSECAERPVSVSGHAWLFLLRVQATY